MQRDSSTAFSVSRILMRASSDFGIATVFVGEFILSQKNGQHVTEDASLLAYPVRAESQIAVGCP